MALPTLITIHGKFVKPDGSPEQGVITFTSEVNSLDSETATVMVPGSIPAYLAADGSVNVILPATNDPEWTPSGWTYTLIAQFSEAFYSYEVAIPYDAPGHAIAVNELVPASPDSNNTLYAPYNHSHTQYLTQDELTGAVNDAITASIPTIIVPAVDSAVDEALGSYATTDQLAAKAPINSPSFTGTVSGVTKSMVGLGNVDNTSDVNKPISTATQTALDAKAAIVHSHTQADVQGLSTSLNAKSDVGHTHSENEVIGLTTALGEKANSTDLAPVALSGSYEDLTDKPSVVGAPVTSVAGRLGDVVLTKSDVGLNNVDNTSDINKPVSSATQTALNLKADTSALAPVATSGDYDDLTNKPTIPTPPVTSVAGKTGAVTLAKADVGLANVDNTSDVNKPISTATQTALNGKANTTHNHVVADVTNLQSSLDAKVTGPASSTDNAVARFDATTGKLIQDSLVSVTDSGSLVLTPQAAQAYARGQLYYNSVTESLEFQNNNSNVAMQIGQELWIRVWNATGATIANGVPVYINGADATSGLPTVTLASASAISTATVAGVTTEAITTGSSGYVTVSGTISNMNTSSWTVGTILYLATTAGTLTATLPTEGNYRVTVGRVLSQNATTGRIQVFPASPVLAFSAVGNRLVGMNNAATANEYKTLNGTANQVGIAHAANSITVSLVNNTALPGAPTAATATAGTNTTQIATTAFVQTAVSGKADTSALTTLSGRVTAVEDMTPVVMVWNGSSYVESNTARIYVGPNDPGTVPDGSVWIDTDA